MIKLPAYNKRDLYLERIKPFVDTQIIKVITGQRRVEEKRLSQNSGYPGPD